MKASKLTSIVLLCAVTACASLPAPRPVSVTAPSCSELTARKVYLEGQSRHHRKVFLITLACSAIAGGIVYACQVPARRAIKDEMRQLNDEISSAGCEAVRLPSEKPAITASAAQ